MSQIIGFLRYNMWGFAIVVYIQYLLHNNIIWFALLVDIIRIIGTTNVYCYPSLITSHHITKWLMGLCLISREFITIFTGIRNVYIPTLIKCYNIFKLLCSSNIATFFSSPGLEGTTAAQASDFAFTKFKFLRRAMLVHGHWYVKLLLFYLLWFDYDIDDDDDDSYTNNDNLMM